MRTLEEILEPLDSGILVYRFPSFDTGPDLEYIFMYNISNIEITIEGARFHIGESIHPNQLTKDYKSTESDRLKNKPKWVHNKNGAKYIDLLKDYIYEEKVKVLDKGSIYLPLDYFADSIFYTSDSDIEKSNPLEIFPSYYSGRIFG
jgi:hypothetical protein